MLYISMHQDSHETAYKRQPRVLYCVFCRKATKSIALIFMGYMSATYCDWKRRRGLSSLRLEPTEAPVSLSCLLLRLKVLNHRLMSELHAHEKRQPFR